MLRKMRRASAIWVAFWAAITELVILAAAGNQWVFDHLVKNAAGNELPRNHELKATLTSLPWRFTPPKGQHTIWLAQLLTDIGLVVLVFLLIWAYTTALRLPRGFFAVLLGVWGIVAGATQVAVIVRSLIVYGSVFGSARDPDRLGRVWYSVFRAPTGETLLLGAASGLLVAIVAAIVALITNKRAVAAAEEEAETAAVPGRETSVLGEAAGAPWPPGEPEPYGAERESYDTSRDVYGAGSQTQAMWPAQEPGAAGSATQSIWQPGEGGTSAQDGTRSWMSEGGETRTPPASRTAPTERLPEDYGYDEPPRS